MLKHGHLILDDLFWAEFGPRSEIGELSQTGIRCPGEREDEKYSDETHLRDIRPTAGGGCGVSSKIRSFGVT